MGAYPQIPLLVFNDHIDLGLGETIGDSVLPQGKLLSPQGWNDPTT